MKRFVIPSGMRGKQTLRIYLLDPRVVLQEINL